MNLAWWLVPAFGEKWDEEPKSKAANRLDFRCFVPSQEMKRNRRTLLPVAAWFDLDAFLSMPRYTTEYTASSVVHRPGTRFRALLLQSKVNWTHQSVRGVRTVGPEQNTGTYTHTDGQMCDIITRIFSSFGEWCNLVSRVENCYGTMFTKTAHFRAVS